MSPIGGTGWSAKTIANYFLELAARDHLFIDPLKLQKLVYLAHGWSLLFLHRPLIRDRIEAWRYGPVVPDLYEEFKKFGGSAITELATPPKGENTDTIDAKTKSLLDSVWNRYRNLSPIQLSMLTHEPGMAWDLVQREGEISPWGGPRIPNELIADEFIRRQQELP